MVLTCSVSYHYWRWQFGIILYFKSCRMHLLKAGSYISSCMNCNIACSYSIHESVCPPLLNGFLLPCKRTTVYNIQYIPPMLLHSSNTFRISLKIDIHQIKRLPSQHQELLILDTCMPASQSQILFAITSKNCIFWLPGYFSI